MNRVGPIAENRLGDSYPSFYVTSSANYQYTFSSVYIVLKLLWSIIDPALRGPFPIIYIYVVAVAGKSDNVEP